MYPLREKGKRADYEVGGTQTTVGKAHRASGLFLLGARILLVLAVVALSFDYFSDNASGGHKESTHGEVNENTVEFWNTIPVSWYKHNDIVWKDCYGEKQCARFSVPLDYLNENADGPWATIALVRVPAKVPPESPAYRGPILFNPGGPGGSGVALIAQFGSGLQRIIGEDFDIVGFDPRGVGFTTPYLSIFKDDGEGMAWSLRESAAPLWNSSSDAIPRLHARSTVLNTLIGDRAAGVVDYVSTASVARDMLEITKAHGRDKLQYWGFSYGSVLGATYAAMFPNNVERLIIDGVMDTRNYYTTLWSQNLVDTEKGLDMFFEECVAAGPDLCGLYESNAQKVKARFNGIIENLKRRPLAVPASDRDSTSLDYGVIDYAIVKNIVFLFLYNPYVNLLYPGQSESSAASRLSFHLSEVEKGNGLSLWNVIKSGLPHFECHCGSESPESPLLTPLTTLSIMCGDGEAIRDTIDELEDHMYEMNSTFADLWPWRVRCSNWKVRPQYRFTGPYGGNTSFPLLIIGNAADPVTPLASAHSVGHDFKNSSVVLTQNSAGHCSIAALSICTIKAIQVYFRNGELPKPGTVCETEAKMFMDGGSGTLLNSSYTAEEQNLVEAWGELGAVFSGSDFGLVKSHLKKFVY
ncbi:TAP-like protein-domain-containing protein [Irpex rosettiformis]|uniref:TAP-like protein-domain-containing protein n=1 Tax=Irpex rosettiformis TaxID=378272 RepID=A0ACB8TWQ5_9APHY|nr:TAP-like protein-domain-containing protein [Irpex rosettiformis]